MIFEQRNNNEINANNSLIYNNHVTNYCYLTSNNILNYFIPAGLTKVLK